METINNLIKIDKARRIGILFLLAFPAYGFGRSLFESENAAEQYLGAALIIINSTLVFLWNCLEKTGAFIYSDLGNLGNNLGYLANHKR